MVDLAAAMLVLRGCFFQNVRTQQSKMEMFCKIAGSVSTEHETTSPMPVGLVRHSGGALDERQNWSLADHFVLESSGPFRVGPGTYGLVAFEDVKRGRRVSTHRTVPPLDNDSRGRQSGGAERGKIKRFLQAAGKDERAKKLWEHQRA